LIGNPQADLHVDDRPDEPLDLHGPATNSGTFDSYIEAAVGLMLVMNATAILVRNRFESV
jgi:hypothetical protein